MAIFKMVEESSATGKVKEVFEDIKSSRGITEIPNFWKMLANDPAELERSWNSLKQVMRKGELDPITKENSLQILLGSHKLPKLVRPTKWSNNKPWYKNDENFMDMPSINTDENILKSEMNLGDAILFNFKVLHSSSGNETNTSRRAFSMRFIGDDVKYLGRVGETSPPFKGIGLKDGEVMRKDWFPIVWTS